MDNSEALTRQCHCNTALTHPSFRCFINSPELQAYWLSSGWDLSSGETTLKLPSHQLTLIKKETQGHLKHTLEISQEWGLLGLKKNRKQQDSCSQTPFSARVQAPNQTCSEGRWNSSRGGYYQKSGKNAGIQRRRGYISELLKSSHAVLDSALSTIKWQSNSQRNKINHTNSMPLPSQEK